jgi:type IX secretion system PorP/SprF family membrane protein
MKRNFIYLFFLFILITVLVPGLQCQVKPVYYHSQYLFNYYLINPAIAGSNTYPLILLSSRQNVQYIDGSPRTQILSLHSRIPYFGKVKKLTQPKPAFSNIAVGGYLFNDSDGPFRKTGFQATYAYHLPLISDFLSNLSFGISFNAFTYRIDFSALHTLNDPLINGANGRTFVPDANFGIFYYGPDAYVSLAVMQLFETPVKWSDDVFARVPVERDYFLMAGFKYNISRLFSIDPSFLFRTAGENISEFYRHFDINLRINYTDFSVGISYRNNQSIAVLGQYRYQNILAGLIYSYPVGEISNYHPGIVEVMAGYNFGGK